MKRFVLPALGAALCLLSLWGGAFALHTIGFGHWAHFPAFLTFLCLFGVGLAVITANIKI